MRTRNGSLKECVESYRPRRYSSILAVFTSPLTKVRGAWSSLSVSSLTASDEIHSEYVRFASGVRWLHLAVGKTVLTKDLRSVCFRRT